MRYKQNLRVENNKVFSYNTWVATIQGGDLLQLGYWSQTTQKHINYVADYFNLKLINCTKNKTDETINRNRKGLD